MGLEPMISGFTIQRFDQLTYTQHKVVRSTGLEPATVILKGCYSTKIELRSHIINFKELWQAMKESNFQLRIWNPSCYHYTNHPHWYWRWVSIPLLLREREGS